MGDINLKRETALSHPNLKVSKVLMNPPFALKKGDEKEYKFIDFALDKMEKGGYLFAIIPSPICFDQKTLKWRIRC